jgi:hypothetical protein
MISLLRKNDEQKGCDLRLRYSLSLKDLPLFVDMQ